MHEQHWVWGPVEPWAAASAAQLNSVTFLKDDSFSPRTSAHRLSPPCDATEAPADGNSEDDALPQAIEGASVAAAPAPSPEVLPRSSDSLLEAALGDLWSRGSRKHSRGACTVCAYVMGTQGCAYGRECRFCHIPHALASRKKLGLARRVYIKVIAAAIENAYRNDLDSFHSVARVVGSSCVYLNGLLRRRLSALESGLRYDGSGSSDSS